MAPRYKAKKQEYAKRLPDIDYTYIDWNALTGDSESTKPTADKIMENLQKTAGGKRSVVLLMHDSAAKKITAETLPQVIEFFKNQGYEFKTFNDILK